MKIHKHTHSLPRAHTQITIGNIYWQSAYAFMLLCFYVSNRNESFASGNLKIHNRKHYQNEKRENQRTKHNDSKENANFMKCLNSQTIIIILLLYLIPIVMRLNTQKEKFA